MYLSLNRTICTTLDKTKKYAHRIYINVLKSNIRDYNRLDGVNKYKALNYLMSYYLEIKEVGEVWVEVSRPPQYFLHIMSYVDTYCK